MQPIRVKTVQESDLRMLGNLARNIQRVLPVTQADIDAAAALGNNWVVWKVVEVNDPIDNLRGGTQLVIRQNSILPGQNVRRVIFVSGPGGETVIVRGSEYIALPDAIANSLEYLKAFGGTEQRNLPDNYIQRQFIYMMDGSYLLTDIVPTYDGRIEFDFATTSLPATGVNFLGGRTVTYGGLLLAKTDSGVFVVDAFDSSSSGRYTSNVMVQNDTRYKFIFNNKVATLESGGSALFTKTFSGTGANGAALAINANNNNGTIVSTNAGIYLYSFKAWNAQGEMVADYVPAVQKGTVPVVGFYDTVSKTFKTATAGTFAAGGEAVPTPDTPMDIVSNNGVLKARHQSGLPLGYTLLNYIESSGTQWIDTGYMPNANTKIRIHGKQGATDCALFGVSLIFYCFSNTTNTLHYNLTGNSGTLAFNLQGLDATIVMSAIDGVVVNGTQLATVTAGSSTASYTMALFGRINNIDGTIAKLGTHKIYSCELWDNGVLARNFVPCKNASNVVGMYDTVTNTFFTNAGTGTFIAGTAVSDPVEIYTDGTVETINVHGKNLFDITALTRNAGYMVNTTNGAFNNSDKYTRSDYIPVLPNTQYTRTASGAASTVFFDVNKNFLSSRTGIPFTTPSDCYYVMYNVQNSVDYSQGMMVKGDELPTTYEPYFNGGTATAEMLLKIDDYEDVQEILSGAITRNVGVKVFDGTEDWNLGSTSERPFYLNSSIDGSYALPNTPFCTHFQGVASTVASLDMPDLTIRCGYAGYAKSLYIKYKSLYSGGVDAFKQYLADQYAAGTPVIVVYPLATPTTESVAGQTMQVQAGDNVVEITQASLDNLELEAKYEKTV